MRMDEKKTTEIAKELGVSRKTVTLYIKQAREEYLQEHRGKAAELAEHYLGILDQVIEKMMEKVEQGDPKSGHVVVRACNEARIWLGCAPPPPREVKVTTTRSAEELARLQDELVARLDQWQVAGAVEVKFTKVDPIAERIDQLALELRGEPEGGTSSPPTS